MSNDGCTAYTAIWGQEFGKTEQAMIIVKCDDEDKRHEGMHHHRSGSLDNGNIIVWGTGCSV